MNQKQTKLPGGFEGGADGPVPELVSPGDRADELSLCRELMTPGLK